MKKIIASELLTFDGYFAGLNGEVDWFMWDEDTDREVFKLMAETDCLLLGHETYHLLAGYWSTATEEDQKFIELINSLPKIVVSRNNPSLNWNAKVLQVQREEEMIEAISDLKKKYNLLIFGSGSVVSLLTKHKLIDEYRLFMNPLILGSGKPLFKENEGKGVLNLTNTTAFGNGIVLLEYKI